MTGGGFVGFLDGIAERGGLIPMTLGSIGNVARGLSAGLMASVRFADQLIKKFAIIGAAGAYGLFKVARGASELGEQTDRARVVFGDASGKIIEQSQVMAGAWGVVRSEFTRSTAAMGGMFQGLGYTADQAADLSINLQKMAIDTAAVTQIPLPEVLGKIESGLAGNIKGMRELGVFMNNSTLQAKAEALAIKESSGMMTEQEKIQARLAIITEGLAYAQGNAAKTAMSAEMATMALLGRIQNLADTIGTALLPIVADTMTQLQVAVEALGLYWHDMTAGIVNDQIGVVDTMSKTSDSVGWVQKSVGFLADAWQAVKIGFLAAQAVVTTGIVKIAEGVQWLGSTIKGTFEMIPGVKLAGGEGFSGWIEELKRTNEAQYMNIDKLMEQPWASKDVDKYFGEAKGRIEAMREKAMAPGKTLAQIGGPKPAEAKDLGVPKFASVAEMGSKEAANLMLRSRYGGDVRGPDAGRQTAENTRKTAEGIGVLVGEVAALTAKLGAPAASSFGDAAGRALAGLF